MTTMKHSFGASMLLLALFVFTQCKEDDSATPKTTGTAQIEITDGPIDDANVKGAFVTIAAVKVDGQEISGFSKTTIDLMAYQNGSTKALGSLDLESGNYSEITLVLDHAQDASGNAPGCYVLTTDNVKHSLQTTSNSTNEIKTSAGDFTVQEGSTTIVVMDFDLRKALRYEDSPQSDDKFDFVTDSELRSSIRFVVKLEAGMVSGSCKDNLNMSGDKIVVYAYNKGSFNKDTEVSGQGESEVHFKNAVSSAVVNEQGNYTLAFLKEGDYELHFFGYEDSDNDGKMEIVGELQVSLLGNLGFDLNNLSVGAGANISLPLNVVGILP